VHAQAYRFIETTLGGIPKPAMVIEFGSRNVNGTPRPLLPDAAYVGVDRMPGAGVDVVCDGALLLADELADLTLCAEVLEHAENWVPLVRNMVACTTPGGHLIITCATEGRAPHSAHDGGALRQGEYYRNVPHGELTDTLTEAGALVLTCLVHPGRGDLYVLAEVPM
jgi:hypothetical protein